MKRVLIVLIGFVLLLVGCGGAATTTTLAPTTTAPAVTTTTAAPTTTTFAPTTTTTAAEATTTTTNESGLPTYSEVVATYPAGVTMSDAEVDMLPNGSYQVTSGSLTLGSSAKESLTSYGIKITVKERMSLFGKTYEAGTKLTVDAKKQLVPVSSWD